MSEPHGPRPISPQGQLGLPKELLEAVGLKAGSEVYVMENEDPKGTILIVPKQLLTSWVDRGRQRRGSRQR